MPFRDGSRMPLALAAVLCTLRHDDFQSYFHYLPRIMEMIDGVRLFNLYRLRFHASYHGFRLHIRLPTISFGSHLRIFFINMASIVWDTWEPFIGERSMHTFHTSQQYHDFDLITRWRSSALILLVAMNFIMIFTLLITATDWYRSRWRLIRHAGRGRHYFRFQVASRYRSARLNTAREWLIDRASHFWYHLI